jgi:hypothetical protein
MKFSAIFTCCITAATEQTTIPSSEIFSAKSSRSPAPKVRHHITQRLYGGDALSFLAHYFPFLPKSWRKEHHYQNAVMLPKNTIGFYASALGMQITISLLITDFLRYPLLVFLYPLAAVTVSLFLVRIRTCAEHMRPNSISEKDFARSHKPNRFDCFFFYDANFNYHFEHHIVPHLPAHSLPNCSKAFETQIHDCDTMGQSMLRTIAAIVRQLPE